MRASLFALACLGAAALSCAPKMHEPVDALLAKVPDSAWERLSTRTVYFGHQSVGYDIVSGVGALEKRHGKIKLGVLESKDPAAWTGPGLVHSKIGVNKDPLSKIQDFQTLMEAPAGRGPDIAFFKFCYVDIDGSTDVGALFDRYKQAMASLRAEHPSVQFVHVTTPLTVIESGPKAWAKKILGRPLEGAAGNVRRSAFNELLLKEYDGRDPVFDLAKFESTQPDGGRETFRFEGKSYPRLIADYSYDGRHLNETGAEWIAAHLLALLARLEPPVTPATTAATLPATR